jgi:hypothetical protein
MQNYGIHIEYFSYTMDAIMCGFFSDPPKSVSELVTYVPSKLSSRCNFVPPMTCFLTPQGGQVGCGCRKCRGGCRGGRFWLFWPILAFFWKFLDFCDLHRHF